MTEELSETETEQGVRAKGDEAAPEAAAHAVDCATSSAANSGWWLCGCLGLVIALGLDAVDFLAPIEFTIFNWVAQRVGDANEMVSVADGVGYGLLVAVIFATALVLSVRPNWWAGLIWWMALCMLIGAATMAGALYGWWLSPLNLWVGSSVAGLAAMVYCQPMSQVGSDRSESTQEVSQA